MKIFNNTIIKKPSNIVLSAVLFILVFFIFNHSLGVITTLSDEESLNISQQSVLRSAVQCYALEGQYPKTLNYLKNNYGLMVDENKFFIDYIYIGSNLLPDVTVVPLDKNIKEGDFSG